MDSFKFYQYFTDRLKIKKSTNGWYLTDCPYCDAEGKKRILRMNFGQGYMNCMSASCEWNTGHRLIDFVVDWESMSYLEAKEFVDSYDEGAISLSQQSIEDIAGAYRVLNIELPTGYRTILEGEGNMAERARTYMQGRGFNLETLDRMGVGYCNFPNPDYGQDYFGYIIIPYKMKNRVYYYNGRNYIGGSPKYKNPSKDSIGVGKSDLLFNEDCMYLNDEIYIMEGALDAMSMDDNAVALGGMFLSTVQRSKIIKSPCKRVVVTLDNNFYKDSLRIAADLIEHKQVYAVKLEGGDPNELGSEVIYELRKSAKPLTFSSILKQLAE